MKPAAELGLDHLLALGRVWILEAPAGPAWPDDPEVAEEIDRLAAAHGLLPFLHEMGERHPATRPPDGERGLSWEGQRFESFAFQSALYDLLEEVATGCRKVGCPVAILKGPAAAARVWRDVGLRPTSDLDLLCRAGDLPVVAGVVRAAGLAPGAHDATYHMSFRGDRPGFVLELHFGLYDFLEGPALRRALMDSVVEIDLDGRAVPALSPEAALTFDLAHWLHHDGRLRLLQLLELAAALWRPTVQPGGAADLLATAGLADEAAVMVRTLGRLFSLPEPPARLASPSGLDRLDAGFEREVRWALVGREETELPRALGETLARGGWARVAHAARLAWPPSRELRALHGCGWWGAQVRRPRHLAVAAGRALAKLAAPRAVRGGGSARAPTVKRGVSLKREVYRRARKARTG